MSAAETQLLNLGPDVITVDLTNDISFGGYVANYGGWNEVVDPWHYRVPFMSVSARLLLDGMTLSRCSTAKHDVYRVTTSRSLGTPAAATYQNITSHFVEFPPGYYPPSSYTVIASDVFWID